MKATVIAASEIKAGDKILLWGQPLLIFKARIDADKEMHIEYVDSDVQRNTARFHGSGLVARIEPDRVEILSDDAESIWGRNERGRRMKVAVYDNPDTMRREAWVDGSVEGFLSASLLMSKGFNVHDLAGKIPWVIDDAPFDPGRIIYDEDAIRKTKKGGGE